MMCEACNEREATVKLIAIINGVKTERHLCGECVEKQKQRVRAEGMQSMLSAIISGARRSQDGQAGLKCSGCGLSYDEFRKTSRLGCAQCYKDFDAQLKPLLIRLHGSTHHAGRMPEHVDEPLREQSALDHLRREMEVAIACEDFEAAATLRDQMRALTPCEGGDVHA